MIVNRQLRWVVQANMKLGSLKRLIRSYLQWQPLQFMAPRLQYNRSSKYMSKVILTLHLSFISIIVHIALLTMHRRLLFIWRSTIGCNYISLLVLYAHSIARRHNWHDYISRTRSVMSDMDIWPTLRLIPHQGEGTHLAWKHTTTI